MPCVEERSNHVRLHVDLFICSHYHNQELISGILINTMAVIILQKHAVVTLRKNAGIQGYKINRSLRATNTTWFFDSDVDDQFIMESLRGQVILAVKV